MANFAFMSVLFCSTDTELAKKTGQFFVATAYGMIMYVCPSVTLVSHA